jgi:Ca-activated chloride channel family protein
MTEDLLAINIQSSRESIAALEGEQLLYLLVNVDPPKKSTIQYFPRNLSLIIDCSTSMKGERLANVKNAAGMIIDNINSDDVISVVAFSDRAEIVRPAGVVKNKAAAISNINGIRASGGTEIFQGLEAAHKEIRKSPLDSFNSHIILLTDGNTYGDTKECLQLARDAAVDGIDISAFGIGHDWNAAFLDKLVALSGSQSFFVEKPSQVMGYLQDRIRGLGAVYASSFRLVHDFPSGVELLTVFKIAPYAQQFVPDGLDIRLGAIEADSPLAVLLEFQIEAQNPDNSFHLPIRFLSDIPSRHIRSLSSDHELEFPVSAENSPIEPPSQLAEAVKALNLYRMNERIWQDIEEGDIPSATRRLERFNSRLLEAGHLDLAEQFELETSRLRSRGDLPESARLRLRFGTRSLITQTIRLES